MKFTTKQRISGELACQNLSNKAFNFYIDTEPLTVYQYEDNNGKTLYAYCGAIGDRQDMTFEELNECFEELAD